METSQGYDAGDVLGRYMHDLIAPARFSEAIRAGFGRFALSGDGPVLGRVSELSAVRKGGEEFPIEMSISAISHKGRWHAIGIVRDVSERKKVEERIRQLAYYDTLTGLPNRRLLLDRLEHVLTQAKRHQFLLAVLFLDLDGFKHINDTRGHDVGDELLKAVAGRLCTAVRAGDEMQGLLQRADRAMYAAKHAGRNCFRFSPPDSKG